MPQGLISEYDTPFSFVIPHEHAKPFEIRLKRNCRKKHRAAYLDALPPERLKEFTQEKGQIGATVIEHITTAFLQVIAVAFDSLRFRSFDL